MCGDENAMAWMDAVAAKKSPPNKMGFIYMLAGDHRWSMPASALSTALPSACCESGGMCAGPISAGLWSRSGAAGVSSCCASPKRGIRRISGG